jgi:hypothetical protein
MIFHDGLDEVSKLLGFPVANYVVFWLVDNGGIFPVAFGFN